MKPFKFSLNYRVTSNINTFSCLVKTFTRLILCYLVSKFTYFQSIDSLRNYFLCLSWQTCCNIHFCKQNYPKNYTHSPINCIVMEGSLPSGLRSPDDIIGSSLDNDTLAPHNVKKGSTLLFRKMLTMPSSQAFELNLIWSKWSHRSRSLLTFTSQIHLKLNFKHNI